MRFSGEKAFLFLAHFDAKQCTNSFQYSHFCDCCPALRSVAFRFSLVHDLLLDLDSLGGNDSDGLFAFFFKCAAWELALNLAVVFRPLVRGDSFPEC